MTIYYDPQKSITLSACHWHNTAFRAVARKKEFWFFLSVHVGFTLVVIYAEIEVSEMRWEAAGALQLLLMLMLIYYNENCYARYMEFYPSCMNAMHSTMLFVHELAISMPQAEGFEPGEEALVERDGNWEYATVQAKYRDNQYQVQYLKDRKFESRVPLSRMRMKVEKYRLAASRYMLAAIYLFYMGITGGSPSGEEWSEVERKGLLSRTERDMLQDYPDGRVTMILTGWAMQVMEEALLWDCFHRPRAPHSAHLYNRLDKQVNIFVTNCHHIHYLLMNPIPYPYFHILNYVMVMNFLMMALAMATFGNLFSLVAYGFGIMVYMGLREVSIALADPFGQDDVDFQITSFMDYTFDHVVGLLEATSHPLAHERLLRQLETTKSFTNEELLRGIHPVVMHAPGKSLRDDEFAWHSRGSAVQHISIVSLRRAFIVDEKDNRHRSDTDHHETDKLEEDRTPDVEVQTQGSRLAATVEAEMKVAEQLRNELANALEELEKLELKAGTIPGVVKHIDCDHHPIFVLPESPPAEVGGASPAMSEAFGGASPRESVRDPAVAPPRPQQENPLGAAAATAPASAAPVLTMGEQNSGGAALLKIDSAGARRLSERMTVAPEHISLQMSQAQAPTLRTSSTLSAGAAGSQPDSLSRTASRHSIPPEAATIGRGVGPGARSSRAGSTQGTSPPPLGRQQSAILRSRAAASSKDTFDEARARIRQALQNTEPPVK